MENNRPMRYPYTMTAKIIQFPVQHYMKKSWLAKWWIGGLLLSLPIFYKIGELSKSPENVKKWEEIRRKQFSGEMRH